MKKHFDISIQFLARKFKLARKRAYQVNFFSSLIRTVNINENSLKTCKTFFYCMMLLWRKFINHRKNADIIDASSRFQRCLASVLKTRKPPSQLRFFFATEIDFGTETFFLRPCLSLFWPLWSIQTILCMHHWIFCDSLFSVLCCLIVRRLTDSFQAYVIMKL